jgi:hypothetical protein
MKQKIIAYNIRIEQWDDMAKSAPLRIEHFISIEVPFLATGELEEMYKEKISIIQNMFEKTSPENILKLINDNIFLKRPMPMHKTWTSALDNHLGQIELACLAVNLKKCWTLLSNEQIDLLINFLITKTNETLGSEAACFTLSLKQLIDGLLHFKPYLKPRLHEIIQKRRDFYKQKPTRLNTVDANILSQ